MVELEEKKESLISVLLVDDEPNIKEVAELYLEKRFGGFKVTTVDNGAEALDLLSCKKFDIIVSDYQMSDIDGLKLLQYMRANGNKTPFIMCTGKSRHEIVIEALNAGADFYIQKGEDPIILFTEMKQMIHQAVSKKRFEKALFESRNLLEDIIEFLPDATVVINTNKRIIAWNKKIEELTGISQNDMLGREIEDSIFSRCNDSVVPLLKLMLNSEDDMTPSAENESDWNISKEYCTCCNNTKKYFRVTVSPIPDLNYGNLGLIGHIRDITQEKRAEYELYESRESFRALIENNIDIVTRFNTEGKHLYISPSVKKYISFSPEAFIGKKYSEILSEKQKGEEWDKVINEVLLSGKPSECEISFESLVGEVFFNWRLFPESDHEGNIISILSIARDITRQIKDETEKKSLLKQIERNLAELAILNDGIRNPLAVITGWLSMIETVSEKEKSNLFEQIKEIDEMITQLDKRWVESDKVLGFLRRHYSIQNSSIQKNNTNI